MFLHPLWPPTPPPPDFEGYDRLALSSDGKLVEEIRHVTRAPKAADHNNGAWAERSQDSRVVFDSGEFTVKCLRSL